VGRSELNRCGLRRSSVPVLDCCHPGERLSVGTPRDDVTVNVPLHHLTIAAYQPISLDVAGFER
jgi:hypothetical protein